MTVRDITLSICELGWLFQRVTAYLKQIFAGVTDAHGLLVQAFGFALQEELQDYYRLLAVLEQEVHRDSSGTGTSSVSAQFLVPAPSQDSQDARFTAKQPRNANGSSVAASTSATGNTNLTLLRLKAWMQEPLER